jgi:hypothetical protein
MNVGVDALSRTSVCATRRFETSYSIFVSTVDGSTNSSKTEVCVVAVWIVETSLPSCGAPRAARCSVRGRRRHCRERRVWPDGPFGAEAAADERTDNADGRDRKAENLRQPLARAEYALRGIVDRQHLAVPLGNRRMRFHRIVMFDGRRIDAIDADGRSREGGFGRAADDDARFLMDVIRRIRVGVCERRYRSIARIADLDEGGRVRRALEGIGDHDRHRLPIVANERVLQDRKIAIGRSAAGSRMLRDTRRILVRKYE